MWLPTLFNLRHNFFFSQNHHTPKPWPQIWWKKPEEPVWLWARVLWSCLGALALCSNHSKNYVPMWGSWCPLCAISILFEKNHNWRDFSALQFNPGISGGRGKKILGVRMPHPLSTTLFIILSSFCPSIASPHCEGQQASGLEWYWQLWGWLAGSVSSSSLHHTKEDFIHPCVRPLTFDH